MIKRPSINWFKLNRQLHRDIGYLSIGLTVVFAVSGLALNHIRDFNPNYAVTRIEQPFNVDLTQSDEQINQALLASFDIDDKVKASYWESKKVYKLFFDGGHTLTLYAVADKAIYEAIEARPILPQFNRLHLNEARQGWVIFSDIYAVFLLYLALSALFMVKGKKGAFSLQKGWLVVLGAAIPVIFIFWI